MSRIVGKLHLGASISLIALILLCLSWEIFLAPLHNKALPLLVPLFGILKGKRYTFQWASMLIMFYFIEGVVRAWSDQGLSAQLAMIEIALSLVFFVCTIFYARHTRKAAL